MAGDGGRWWWWWWYKGTYIVVDSGSLMIHFQPRIWCICVYVCLCIVCLCVCMFVYGVCHESGSSNHGHPQICIIPLCKVYRMLWQELYLLAMYQNRTCKDRHYSRKFGCIINVPFFSQCLG